MLNELDLHADIDEQEALFLALAAGRSNRLELERWLERQTTARKR